MDTDNPFFNDKQSRSEVAVAHGQGPYQNTIAALKSIPLEAVRGKRVLLKPNAGRIAQSCSGITTHPEVVAAAIDAFREAGADVAVGESPITGVKVTEAFEATGIAAEAKKRNCPLIDMDVRPFIEVEIPDGRVLHKLKLCADVPEFDIIVSIPVMKMHMHTDVTLSVKNMKGCLWRRSKVKLHMLAPIEGSDEKPINVAIVDMASVLRPHLAIIDGTVGMEGLGPGAGEPKQLDCVVVGVDGFAADAVACRLMGTRAQDVPHLYMGAERNLGVIDLSRINVSPENWQDWSCSFAKPPQNLSIEFPKVTVWDNNSCSACQSTLLLFLKEFADRIFDYLPDREHLDIAIGKGNKDLPEKTLCIGNCTAQCRHGRPYVPGCPPVASEILKKLTGHTTLGPGKQTDKQ
jgi:uncharacterized protein (DUF362 family)